MVTICQSNGMLHAASEAKAVTSKFEGELGQVQRVVQEGEETVARLRDQLEELHEREEATQLQMAHALTQVKLYNHSDGHVMCPGLRLIKPCQRETFTQDW